MSYQLKIDPKARKVARYVSLLQAKIQAALIASGMTQQEVAEKLGVDRSVINRRLKGKANLTARSIAEFAYAFDKEVVTEFADKPKNIQSNWAIVTQSNVKSATEGSLGVTRGTLASLGGPTIERVSS